MSSMACQHWPMPHAHFHQVQADLRESYRALTNAIPDVMAGYGVLHDAAFVEGALDVKTKELIALSIAITRECDGCIAAHGRNLARLGATTPEVAEMIGVAITMNGGPGLVWGPRALQAFQEYSGSQGTSGEHEEPRVASTGEPAGS